jgi:predicted esterase
VAIRAGAQRRAYRSRVDGTLQPYSISVPRDCVATGARCPLFVYLHGSGEDDRGQLARPWFPQGAILVAPRGRGPSTWYWHDRAQDDVRETIDDVLASYSVDPARIVIAGFSMGGYGVYVTARELAGRFCGLAAFSGAPRARDGPDAGAPDLLLEPDLSAFARLPVFVFHGGRDRNLPIEGTRALVERLRSAGADVTFVSEEDKGHEAPGAETQRAFTAWLARVTAGR